jgi:K+-transporting ATPase ATPase A chain
MNTEILGVILMYTAVLALAIPLGRYIGKVFNYENTWLDKILNPIDNLFFKLSGIDPT